MSNLSTNLQISDVDQDVKAHIYQQLVDFEPFMTEATQIVVNLKDPSKLYSQLKEIQSDITPEDVQKMFRVSIAMTENGTTINSEGLSENIFEAVSIAKDSLIKRLESIQDDVISSQERLVQIKEALQGGQVH